MNACCCGWGAARPKSGEWPEFECADCPDHRQGLGPVSDRCRRHQREFDGPAARARRETEFNDRSVELIDDLVALERELSS